MTDTVLLYASLAFGAVVGSFLNVCIYRLPAGLSIVSPGSRCAVCLRPIPFYHNVPVLSYVVLGGRCARCRAPYSIRYPIVEAAAALLSYALFSMYGLSAAYFVSFAFASALLTVALIDLDHKIIPDVISLPGVVVGFAASFFLPHPGVISSAVGIVAGGGIPLAIAYGYHYATGREGLGGGDVKLLAMIGAFIGWKGVLFTLLAASLSGAVIGSVALAVSGKGARHRIPFGPFLSLGAALYLFFGETIVAWYLSGGGWR